MILSLTMGLWALIVPAAHAATLCHERASIPDGVIWWRMIDGRKCWYQGTRMMDRARLKWQIEPQPEEPPRPALPTPQTDDVFLERWPGHGEFLPPQLWHDPLPIRTWKGP
jgi:hypothetical protein